MQVGSFGPFRSSRRHGEAQPQLSLGSRVYGSAERLNPFGLGGHIAYHVFKHGSRDSFAGSGNLAIMRIAIVVCSRVLLSRSAQGSGYP